MSGNLSQPENQLSEPERMPLSSSKLPENTPLSRYFSVRAPAWRPPVDVYETEDNLVVRVEIGGMHEEDFTIELNGRYLVIRGSRQDISEKRAYHRMEIRFGEFLIEIELPLHVETDRVLAVYQDGFLRVMLPKSHPRHIPVIE